MNTDTNTDPVAAPVDVTTLADDTLEDLRAAVAEEQRQRRERADRAEALLSSAQAYVDAGGNLDTFIWPETTDPAEPVES